MEMSENPKNKGSRDVRLIEQMRTEPLRTTVISRSINNAQTLLQLELEHVRAKR